MARGVLAGTLKPVAVWTGGQGSARYLFPTSPARRPSASAAPRKSDPERLSIKQAAETLGIGEQTVHGLIKDGYLPEAAVGEQTSPWRGIPSADVQAILAAFEQAADGIPLVDAPAPDHRRSGRGGIKDGFGSRAMVEGVLAGTLKPVAVWTGGRGIGRYLLTHPGKGD